eukprot:CAMPEP_0172586642 /NCGR_PEP_ID=MMETSP1068-20121228/5969_1 /TAXON_ID=35684 /ORGANISM="Pseudopedinella elastica, Strain CCMP716" /LENGTH=189 /DNA_ID=CAMNT_0013381501 /DNA_START=108 /DNA_END=674 /DNA_ORIENTATION=+
MAEKPLKQMEKIVDKLYNRQDSVPFREPVNWRELGLDDYPQIVKKPMALADVKSKLTSGQYRSASEAYDDVTLIWYNCMAYNMDGSDFYKLASKFKARFEDMYAKVASRETDGLAVGAGDQELDRAPTPEEQIHFAHNIYMIKSEELGEVVTRLDHSCPSALEKKAAGLDELEINIDAIDPRTFHMLDK